MAPFIMKVLIATEELGVLYYLTKKTAMKTRAQEHWKLEFKNLVVGSARLEHLQDKIHWGPTEIDCRDDSAFWLKAHQGYLHPLGWVEDITRCQLCDSTAWSLPHVLFQCPNLDYPSIRVGE